MSYLQKTMNTKTIAFRDTFKNMQNLVNVAFSNICIKRGFINPDIIIEWSDIIGYELSKSYLPSRISNNRKQTILYVNCVNLRDRQNITYNKNVLIEKINIFLGDKYITDIKIEN